jgi:hypothetical protein
VSDSRDSEPLPQKPGGPTTLVSDVQILPGMLEKSDELRDRVEARKHELLAKYNELKADSRREAAEARTRVKARLDEVERYLKSGWDKATDEVRTKLNKWLEHRD